MSDDDLIRRGDALNACRASEHRYEAHDAIEALPAVTQPAPDAAADRIAALTEQLAAARKDAEEAEAYAGELEVNLATAVELAIKECPFRWGTPRYDKWWQDRRTILALITEKPHDRA